MLLRVGPRPAAAAVPWDGGVQIAGLHPRPMESAFEGLRVEPAVVLTGGQPPTWARIDDKVLSDSHFIGLYPVWANFKRFQ